MNGRIVFDHGISIERAAEWVEVAPGQSRCTPTGAPRIGICIGDYATGPDWFSVAEARQVLSSLRVAIETAEGLS